MQGTVGTVSTALLGQKFYYRWQPWEGENIPNLIHVIQSYDTAFSKKETADYSAITTWGVFYPDEVTPNIILLDAIRGKYDFPELKVVALDAYKYWEPETIVIEQKASGEPLTQEFRRMGIPVVPFTPTKGNDKHTRVNAVAPIFESGAVWFPLVKNLQMMLLMNVQLFLTEQTMTMWTVCLKLC